MKKVIFCLLIGFVTVSCQNGANIKESEIRDNFGGYCGLTGGEYDYTLDPTACICGNYRCYNRACNYEGDDCDDRICYAGDQSCEKSDIKVCRSEKIKGTPNYTPHDFADDYSCEAVSCTQANDKWHYKCGECKNNDFKCVEDDPDNTTGHLAVCKQGKWFNIKKCDGGCKYEDGKTESTECESCTGIYCVNDNNEIGYKYICNSNSRPAGCTYKDMPKNTSCRYDLTEPDCGICFNNDLNCEHVEIKGLDDPISFYISKEECKEGVWVPIGEGDPTAILLYEENSDPSTGQCTTPLNQNVCLKVAVDNSNVHYPLYYHCESENQCTIKVCQYDCSPETGCLEKKDQGKGVCAGDKSCVISIVDDPAPQNKACYEIPDPNPEHECPGDSTCYTNKICLDKCSEEEYEQKNCGEIDTIYCDEPDKPNKYPYLVWNGESNKSVLHIDHTIFDILKPYNNNLEEWLKKIQESECHAKIGTIILHGDSNDKFYINCNDDFKSIKLPSNITVIGANKNENQQVIIQCKDASMQQLIVPLFESLQGVTLENFGININFNFSNVDKYGGVAEDITNSILKNIGIAGNIQCNSVHSCGLLSGSVFYEKNTEPKIELKGIRYDTKTIPIIVESSFKEENDLDGDNVGGLIGTLTIESANITVPKDDPPFKFSDFDIENVNGRNNIGGIIGFIKITSEISATKENKVFDFSAININSITGTDNVGGIIGMIDSKTNTGTTSIGFSDIIIGDGNPSEQSIAISGKNNVGGIIGMIDSKTNTGTTSIGFSDIRIGDDNPSEQSIAISGTNNVGGFIGSIGCDAKGKCSETTPNITIMGDENTLSGTVNGMNNVGGVIGTASGLLALEKFTLNSLKEEGQKDSNDNLQGRVIGGRFNKCDISLTDTSYKEYYTSENIGGLIGKLVIHDLEKDKLKIENIKLKLDTVACGEYLDRASYCTYDETNKKCNPKCGICNIATFCKQGGGLIGHVDMPTLEIEGQIQQTIIDINPISRKDLDNFKYTHEPEAITNIFFTFSNSYIILNTLAIGKDSASIIGFLGKDIEIFDDYDGYNNLKEDQQYGDLKIGRIRDHFRHKLGQVSIHDVLIAVNKVDTRLDQHPSFRGISNNVKILTKIDLEKIVAVIKLNNNANENYCIYQGEYNDSTKPAQIEDYLTHYPTFLIYSPECKCPDYICCPYSKPYEDPCESLTYLQGEIDYCTDNNDNAHIYFYQFDHYSTYYRAYSYHEIIYDASIGQCFRIDESDNKTMCTNLEGNCNSSLNGLNCCPSNDKEQVCSNGEVFCKKEPEPEQTCIPIQQMKSNLNWNTTMHFKINDSEINDFPTPPICLTDKPDDPNCKNGN